MSSRFIDHSDLVLSRMSLAAARAIAKALEFILQQSKEIVPYKDGILEASGSTDIDAAKAKGTVFYDTPYAVRLHEHPEYDFQGKGQGKYLESVIENNRSIVLQMFYSELKGAIGR